MHTINTNQQRYLEQSRSIILFDAVCNLCNGSVQFVIKHDKKKIFLFAALQSDAGQALLKKYNLPSTDFHTFVLIQNNEVFLTSTAALTVAKQLYGIIKLMYIFIIVPPFIRNSIYNFIAKNRYKWFGKNDSCIIPTKDFRNRFL